MKRNDIWQQRLYCNNETRLSVAKEVLVSELFKIYCKREAGKFWQLSKNLYKSLISMIRDITRLLYRANNVVRKWYYATHLPHCIMRHKVLKWYIWKYLLLKIFSKVLQYVTLMVGLNSPTKAVIQNYGSKYTPVLQNNPNERNKKAIKNCTFREHYTYQYYSL